MRSRRCSRRTKHRRDPGLHNPTQYAAPPCLQPFPHRLEARFVCASVTHRLTLPHHNPPQPGRAHIIVRSHSGRSHAKAPARLMWDGQALVCARLCAQCLAEVVSGVVTCDAAEDVDVGHGGGAEAVGAHLAASVLAGCIQTGMPVVMPWPYPRVSPSQS